MMARVEEALKKRNSSTKRCRCRTAGIFTSGCAGLSSCAGSGAGAGTGAGAGESEGESICAVKV